MRDQIEQLARTYIMMKIQAVHCSVAIPMRQRIEELEKKIQKGNFSPPPDSKVPLRILSPEVVWTMGTGFWTEKLWQSLFNTEPPK
jgi:hypothetical protein